MSVPKQKIEENWETLHPLLPKQNIPYQNFFHRHEFLFAESVVLGLVLLAFFTQKSVSGELFPIKIAGYSVGLTVPIIQKIIPEIAPSPTATLAPTTTPTVQPSMTSTPKLERPEKHENNRRPPAEKEGDNDGKIRGISTEKEKKISPEVNTGSKERPDEPKKDDSEEDTFENER